jgi:hypothetical protein
VCKHQKKLYVSRVDLAEILHGYWFTRHFGLAARFVSGYIVQLSQKILRRTIWTWKDFTDLHAWVEVYLPGAGWIDLIPLLAFASEGHIPLCCTPHYESAAPVTGATENVKLVWFWKYSNSYSWRSSCNKTLFWQAMGRHYAGRKWCGKDLIEGDVR